MTSLRGPISWLLGLLLAAPVAAQEGADYEVLHPPPMVMQAPSARPTAPPPPQLSHATRWFAVDPQQVPIDRAGRLEFALNFAEIDAASWRDGRPVSGIGGFWFDAQGMPLSCEVSLTEQQGDFEPDGDYWVISEWRGRALSEEICRQFMASARFHFDSWFSVPIERGFIERKIELSRTITPDLPIQLTSREQGLMVKLTFAQRDGRLDCQADPSRVNSAASSRICQSVLLNPPPDWLRDSNQLPFLRFIAGRDGARETVRVYPAGQLQTGGNFRLIERPLTRIYLGASWPQTEIEPDQRLTNADGHFSAQPEMSDLPVNLHHDFNARITVLLGIAPDGSVATCRPLYTDTFPQIDNATCASLARRGRFVFVAQPRWTGLRYTRTTVIWGIGE